MNLEFRSSEPWQSQEHFGVHGIPCIHDEAGDTWLHASRILRQPMITDKQMLDDRYR
jgi:hypothetical protein